MIEGAAMIDEVLTVPEVESDASELTVSALIWESVFKTPFQSDQRTFKRSRGRPKKHVPIIDGKTVHKLGDEELDARSLIPSSIHKLILDFKEYIEEGKSPKEALELVSELYKIPYVQAFNICADEY